MTKRATGPFEVKITPAHVAEAIADPAFGSMTFDKTFHGGLEGTSKGQMLTAGTARKDSGAYVAVEKFTGTLDGKKGSFLMYHAATMNRGTPNLGINVVPDSGTDDLAGLSGKINIIIAPDGKHTYEFDYAFAEN